MTAVGTSPRPEVAVIGGGLAGLAAGCTLMSQGIDVMLFEAADRPGGVVQTESRAGFLAEAGPNSIAAPSPPVLALLASLGLTERRVAPRPEARHRYVVRDGRPMPLPRSPIELLRSDLLSSAAKLRLLKEPLVPQGAETADESVAAFVRRRLGPEALDYLADPFVAGIYAGDPERLSIRHALPKVSGLERDHGSLLRGMIKAGFTSAPSATGPAFFSFAEGLAELPRAMAGRLDHRVRLNTTITGIRRVGEGWYLTGDRHQLDPLRRYDAVVLALPAYRLSGLAWEGVDARPLHELARIRYVPVATLTLGFRQSAVAHALDGFGMLIPTVEGRRILGTVFNSSLFEGRAPNGHVALTTLVGGARHPALALAGQTAVRTAVMSDLEALLGVTGTPTFESFRCWPKAIPQYDIGYGALVAQADAFEQQWPSVALAGNYRDGLSAGDTMMSGITAAGRLATTLAAVGAAR